MHPKNDRFLVWARVHYGWEVEQMHGLDAGELALFVRWFIVDRFVRGKKATYAYEIAWVFERDRGTIGNVLRNLEAEGDAVRTNPRPGERRTLYLPKWEDAESWFEWAKLGHKEDDGFIAFHRKVHDENCPCKGSKKA